jgi:hypothetical protein
VRIEAKTAVVYFAPSAKRRYLSAHAAANAEADHMMRRKYPTEKGDETDGFHYWDYKQDPNLKRVHARLARMLRKQLRRSLE